MVKMQVRIIEVSSESYHATCPSLPGCETHGRNQQEAREKIEELVRGYLASMDNSSELQLQVQEA